MLENAAEFSSENISSRNSFRIENILQRSEQRLASSERFHSQTNDKSQSMSASAFDLSPFSQRTLKRYSESDNDLDSDNYDSSSSDTEHSGKQIIGIELLLETGNFNAIQTVLQTSSHWMKALNQYIGGAESTASHLLSAGIFHAYTIHLLY
ncbi:hypothetical protein B4U79_14087, partial [Dinothrombium tinctorium]